MSSDDEETYEPQQEDISEHIETDYPVGVEVEVPGTRGQLFKTVLTEGSGRRPPKGSKVHVHYVGTLASDGSKFDSSRDRDQLFDFALGKGSVIKGWDVGVATMKKGEKAILKCLPEYAYGARGSPPKIPANATLNFEVELFFWENMEDISKNKDKSLMKSTLVEGTNWERPDYETELVCNVSVLNSEEEDAAVLHTQADWKIVIGETELPTGLEDALQSMKKGETAVVKVANVTHTTDFPALKAGSPAFLRIELKEFEKVQTWKVDQTSKVPEAKKRKDAGNEHFKKGAYEKAIAKYKRGLEFIEYADGLPEDLAAEAQALKITMWSNIAQCYLNSRDLRSCVEYCNKVLAVDANNTKALFRRGKANGAAQEWEAGSKDLKRLLEIDPNNADAARELNDIQMAMKKHEAQQKARYANLFKA